MPGLIAESKPRSVILETPGPLACFGESFASWYFKTPWLDSSCHNYLPLPFSPVCGSSRIKCSLFPSFKPFLNVPILDLPWQCLHFAVGSSGTLFALPEKQKKKAFPASQVCIITGKSLQLTRGYHQTGLGMAGKTSGKHNHAQPLFPRQFGNLFSPGHSCLAPLVFGRLPVLPVAPCHPRSLAEVEEL